jgi:hypothetical protein
MTNISSGRGGSGPRPLLALSHGRGGSYNGGPSNSYGAQRGNYGSGSGGQYNRSGGQPYNNSSSSGGRYGQAAVQHSSQDNSGSYMNGQCHSNLRSITLVETPPPVKVPVPYFLFMRRFFSSFLQWFQDAKKVMIFSIFFAFYFPLGHLHQSLIKIQ